MASIDHRFHFEAAHLSDVGAVRKINEDSIFTDPATGVWLVADGMGGHAAGDFASQTIAATMSGLGVPATKEDQAARFAERLIRANATIYDQSQKMGRGAVGSTLAALLTFDAGWQCFWSGDSRVYRLRGNRLQRITKDHTEVQALLDAGVISPEEAETWPRKNVITHAVGVSSEVKYDVVDGNLVDGDLFLLCSDGLTEYFEDPEIEKILSEPDLELNSACVHLVGLAIDRGGKDNVSVVIVRCIESPQKEIPPDGPYPEFNGLL